MHLIETRDLSYTYPGNVRGLDHVNFIAPRNARIAVIGANGAGKSTLARIVAGLLPADGGELRLGGTRYAPMDKHAAEACGVHIIQQELNLIGTLSVAENLFLNRLPNRGGFVRRRALHDAAREALAAVGLADLDPATPAGRLGIGRQQMVEIASALSRRCRVLILDEPTAALTDPQTAVLFEHIGRLKKAGVAMIYISHRLEEVRRIADRATVLRDGRVVAAGPIAEFELDRMVQLMAGRPAGPAGTAAVRAPGAVALRVENLVRRPHVRGVSFEARRGEILGIAGLVGSGRSELLRAVFGADRPDSGLVSVGTTAAFAGFRTPAEAVRAGLAMIPEDRKRDGLLLPLPVRVNLTLGGLGAFARGGWLRTGLEAEEAARTCDRMDVRRFSLEQPIAQLSGGNQQKVVIGRWLLRDAVVCLFDEPTRGIDVGAKAAIHRLLGDLAARGRAIVVVSSELDELIALCDRIIVMSAGRLTAEFRRGEASRERIMGAAFEGYLGGGGDA